MADGQQTGRLLLIQIGDGASPEAFTNLCGLTTRNFNLSANEVDTTTPDCVNPGDTPQKTSDAGILSRTFTGQGKYVKGANTNAFMNRVINGEKFNATVIVPGLGSFVGPWIVTNFELGGEMEGTMTFNGTWTAAGKLTFTAEA
ncbi:phage major tail protein, TP901-1 family [Agrobacterium rhizogenes]|uniref:phage major tail protein, TP901-1 family n=1 Tax=Rhizobium rhizogenes TaxID=359 RepID=UPI001574C985|nr:phage major tail protein, TP901-1 family [Rhizobium rhizogenes]NTG48970.1 phage major tail protein, TP901-1 family [Rhizobium rhizogenes]